MDKSFDILSKKKDNLDTLNLKTLSCLKKGNQHF